MVNRKYIWIAVWYFAIPFDILKKPFAPKSEGDYPFRKIVIWSTVSSRVEVKLNSANDLIAFKNADIYAYISLISIQ